MLLRLKTETQRKIALTYYQKLLNLCESDISKWESKLNSAEVNVRQLKEKQNKYIERMAEIECEIESQ